MTHYPLLAELEDQHPDIVGNFHMAYVEADTSECLSFSTMYLSIYRTVNGEANYGGLLGISSAI